MFENCERFCILWPLLVFKKKEWYIRPWTASIVLPCYVSLSGFKASQKHRAFAEAVSIKHAGCSLSDWITITKKLNKILLCSKQCSKPLLVIFEINQTFHWKIIAHISQKVWVWGSHYPTKVDNTLQLMNFCSLFIYIGPGGLGLRYQFSRSLCMCATFKPKQNTEEFSFKWQQWLPQNQLP